MTLTVNPGRVHALLGGNGSGKSTLIKILAGTEVADQGRIRVGTATVSASATSPPWSAAHGLRFVHQDLGLFADLTVAENLFAGRGYPRRRTAIDRHAVRRIARAALHRVHLDVSPSSVVGDLRPAERTMVAVARALHDPAPASALASSGWARGRILVLDEPTAALPRAESERLFDLLGRLRDTGDTIVIVSHRLGEIAAIAEAATVLRDGQVIADLRRGEITNAVLHRLLAPAGTAPRAPKPARPAAPPDTSPRLSVSDLRTSRLNVAHLQVDRGEILGLLGLTGSGTQEFLATIFGVIPGRGRAVRIDGQLLAPRRVIDAVRHGIGYVPPERHTRAAFLDHNVADNLLVASLRRHRTATGLTRRDLHRHAQRVISTYGIKAPSGATAMAALSGGNQQKVVVARWLERQAQLLLLDEPTQGVDVAARADIWRLIHQAVDDGMSVVLTSTDLDEIAAHCDRVLLMRDGAIIRRVDAATSDDLAHALFTN
ncbi:MAG: sugar ABC transporter ATP-binding protein [Jatrophihabitans sp.]|uniref:sugar ABC transporter ATP-binding protein n=1 Tax=Jatrophihabitans sp. TaxID=1932789 RepID=UPI003F805BE5